MRACFCIEGQFPKVGFFDLDTPRRSARLMFLLPVL